MSRVDGIFRVGISFLFVSWHDHNYLKVDVYVIIMIYNFNYTTTLGNGKYGAENGYTCRHFMRPFLP